MRKLFILVICLGMLATGISSFAASPEAQEVEICKAVISAIMNQTPAIMGGKISGGLPHVHYNRPSDGSLWKYKCRIEGGTVTWAMDPGRWRNEDFISYEIKGSKISVYDATAGRTKTFPFKP